MAFVMKRKNNVKITATNEVGKATVLTIDTDSNSRQTEEERKGKRYKGSCFQTDANCHRINLLV